MNCSRNWGCIIALVVCTFLFRCLGVIVNTDLTQAEEVHVLGQTFGEAGHEPGQFNEPTSIAVSSATHDVYVVDKGNGRVEKFTDSGTLLCEFEGHENGKQEIEKLENPTEIAVDNSENPLDLSNGDVYVVDIGRGVIDKLNSSCGFIGEITSSMEGSFELGETNPRSISGIAVDPEGILWVALLKRPLQAFNNGLINSYKESVVTPSGGSFPGGLGVDGEGDFYIQADIGKFAKVSRNGKEGKTEILAPYPFGCEDLEPPSGCDNAAYKITVDPTLNEIYLDSRGNISAFHLSGKKIESFGSFTSSNGVAVDPSDGTVYATDAHTDKVFDFQAFLLPNVMLTSPSDQTPHGLTFNGVINPEGNAVTNCRFEYATVAEYSTAKAYTHAVGCLPATVGGGSDPVPVSARGENLSAETEYRYRLVAENDVKIPAEAASTAFTGPLLEGEFATRISATGATLNVRLNPNGDETHYYFEYGPSAQYGSFAPAEPPGKDAGNGTSSEILNVKLIGLEAGSTYHYRLIVEQGDEEFGETDHIFTTQRSAEAVGVLDGRSWELVTPADKRGALIELPELGGQIQAAADGGRIAYTSTGPSLVMNPAGHVTVSPDFSQRTSAGWVTTDLTLPSRLPDNEEPTKTINPYQIEYHLFSSDLSKAIVEPPNATSTPLLSPAATTRTLYIRDNIDGEFLPLVTPGNVISGEDIEESTIFMSKTPGEWMMHVLAATPDLSHVIVKTPMAWTENAPDEEKIGHEEASRVQWNLYEWSNGQLQLINILPNGSAAHGKASGQPGVRLAGVTDAGGRGRGGSPRSISEDGRWVAWAWGEPYSIEGASSYRGLYVRDMLEGKTMRVGGLSAIYQSMSADGEKIFYLEDGDLYEFNTSTEISTDLTGGSAAGVQETVSDISENGSYVYFVAKGVIATGGVAGANNLYLLHDMETGWTVTFIASLSDEDSPSWTALGDFKAPLLPGIASRVSPNGHFLVFMSNRPLTGYDNRDAISGEPDEEVFLYSATKEHLACVSCNPTEERPHGILDSSNSERLLVDRQRIWAGGTSGGVSHWLAGSVPGWDELNADPTSYQPRYLLNSGRVFFDSSDALVPQDGNGTEDVYEFEPVGVGGCVLEGFGYNSGTGGCLGLVSSGLSSNESAFYDASESGRDVFFDTTAKLVEEDFDRGYDLYDSHVCTAAMPCSLRSIRTPVCESGDACKGPPTLQPEIFGAPPSATFNGIGNVSVVPRVKAKSLTRVQRLARALAACRRERGRHRNACVRRARKRYGAKVPLRSARGRGVEK